MCYRGAVEIQPQRRLSIKLLFNRQYRAICGGLGKVCRYHGSRIECHARIAERRDSVGSNSPKIVEFLHQP